MAVKKQLLLVNDLVQGGGVEKLLYDFVCHWYQKYDITVMTYDYHKEGETFYPKGVRYLSASLKKEYNNQNIFLRTWNKVRRKIYRRLFNWAFDHNHFDMVIAMKEGWIMDHVSRMNIPVKYGWVHTDYSSYYYTYDTFGGQDNERACMQKFNKIVCVSQAIEKGIVDTIGDPGNLCVKYNPIDTQAILKASQEPVVDIEPHPATGVTRFVTVGRLNYQKGFDLLLEACHMLEQDGLNFEVLIVGGAEPWGDEHNRLYRTQKRLKLTSVKFLGARKNPYKYMKCADWFLSSSIFEGYSLVSQEAAVLGIPLILTDCSGVRELLGDNEYGIVMGISVLDIYKNMKRVIEHPELRTHYRERILERKKIINFNQRFNEIEKVLQG